LADNLIEEVRLIDEYEDEQKFGKNKKSYTFRIVYRSPERTLTHEEINAMQAGIIKRTESDLGAMIR
jgi:phenylalanyl-tRNA synthetase beta subunit